MNAEALLAKIEEVKADFASKLDEIAAAAQGEEQGEPMAEGEMAPPEGEQPPAEAVGGEVPPPAEEALKGAAPVAVEEKKMLFAKKKPGGDFRKALGI